MSEGLRAAEFAKQCASPPAAHFTIATVFLSINAERARPVVSVPLEVPRLASESGPCPGCLGHDQVQVPAAAAAAADTVTVTVRQWRRRDGLAPSSIGPLTKH
jgi:hypothetical protein